MSVLKTVTYSVDGDDLQLYQCGDTRTIGVLDEAGHVVQFELDDKGWDFILDFFEVDPQ